MVRKAGLAAPTITVSKRAVQSPPGEQGSEEGLGGVLGIDDRDIDGWVDAWMHGWVDAELI